MTCTFSFSFQVRSFWRSKMRTTRDGVEGWRTVGGRGFIQPITWKRYSGNADWTLGIFKAPDSVESFCRDRHQSVQARNPFEGQMFQYTQHLCQSHMLTTLKIRKPCWNVTTESQFSFSFIFLFTKSQTESNKKTLKKKKCFCCSKKSALHNWCTFR